ncbi:hypothetical protein [Thalassolituus oleivorans]|jgi:hypothetical protein|uniref:hypothetical protein n=1 Tax=Thalassolituus oleivorans TaxID=187493 RepID=UPI0024099643|nr:hypothetical protein [Thalassolituus oleivorans]MDF1641549.1 hypothetical protein [Thalassolituus oleivorans]
MTNFYVPLVEKDDDENKESFSEYLDKWPEELSNFPEEVIEDWVYRHNEFFIKDWSGYNLENWQFELVEFTNKDLLSVQHLPGEIEKCDHTGENIIKTLGSSLENELGRYICDNGTFPVPIIVALNAIEILHPKSFEDEYMATPYQLIEGHRRLGTIRAMLRNGNYDVADLHEVWLISELN